VGSFLPGIENDDGYVPPEQRFYAGGPNTVRGYYRNQLGPQVYVAPADDSENGYDQSEIRNSATGGTRTVVTSVELQTPSPLLRDRLRLAAFLDAGQVWDTRGCGDDRDGGVGTRCNLGLRFTPGAGVRVATPVGPIRLDLAVNPYGREPGPLYVYDPDTGVLDPTPRRFRDNDRRFLDYLTVHIAVGNAF
jgi:outer membrane protein assembly factor BamA